MQAQRLGHGLVRGIEILLSGVQFRGEQQRLRVFGMQHAQRVERLERLGMRFCSYRMRTFMRRALSYSGLWEDTFSR